MNICIAAAGVCVGTDSRCSQNALVVNDGDQWLQSDPRQAQIRPENDTLQRGRKSQLDIMVQKHDDTMMKYRKCSSLQKQKTF